MPDVDLQPEIIRMLGELMFENARLRALLKAREQQVTELLGDAAETED